MSATVEFYAEVLHETEMAVLCEVDGDEVWIPRSVIEDGEDLETGDTGDIEVAEWFAIKEGLV